MTGLSAAGERRAFVFPGQGSQAVGMGRECAEEFAEARAVFAAADHALGFPLSRLCFEGPLSELQLTANTQPAILAASIALYQVLERSGHRPDAVAGHSLGEYSALVAAGALELVDAVRLVRRRGELMQEAVPPGVGAMAAFLGVDETVVREIAAAARGREVCAIANLNAPGQTVIAGHRAAVERAIDEAKRRGHRKAMLLPVSAPFHSPLMAPARDGMAPLLAAVPLRDPRVPVVSNVDARPLERAAEIRDALLRQIDQPVRWVESIERLHRDLRIGTFVEVGPGRVLSGLIKRIVPEANVLSVGDAASLRELLAA
ncbi:MAG TPA: ACP S-malonyltransferase [Thermoanaerobaculia bacterium]|nr:ACP S-malonyltransferase [Thermoanaerobaculia bacterium]